MGLFSKEYVCPFCFTEHLYGDVEFACEQRKICGDEPDAEFTRWRGASMMGPHHFRAGTRISRTVMPDKAVCDKCNHVSHTRVCPACHNELPTTIDTDQTIIVALIGTRGSGKSTYIGVLIHEMQKRIFHNFNGTFQLYGPEDREQYKQRFEEDLYTRHTILNQTQSSFQNNANRNRPILGTLKMQSSGFGKHTQVMTLVFFDSAGEDWEHQDVINVVTNYVSHCEGIIFLVDPLANAAVRAKISNDASIAGSVGAEVGSVSDPRDILTTVADLIRRNRDMKPEEPITIPTAVAFSKLDVLENTGVLSEVSENSTLSKPSPHTMLGKFDEVDRAAVNDEMRGLLHEWAETDFVATLDQNYANNSCFAFSAFGRAPGADGSIAPPAPKRIEDAMLWILHENKTL